MRPCIFTFIDLSTFTFFSGTRQGAPLFFSRSTFVFCALSIDILTNIVYPTSAAICPFQCTLTSVDLFDRERTVFSSRAYTFFLVSANAPSEDEAARRAGAALSEQGGGRQQCA